MKAGFSIVDFLSCCWNGGSSFMGSHAMAVRCCACWRLVNENDIYGNCVDQMA